MEKMKTIDIDAGSELAKEMYEFQIGDIAYVTNGLIHTVEDQIEDWESPIDKDEYEKIIGMIEDLGDSGVDKLIALGILSISLSMSFFANIQQLSLRIDIEDADKESL